MDNEVDVSSPTLQVHRKIREDTDMAQDSLQCLAQLASMHGPIFPDESAQVSYLAHLVEGLLSMINGSVSLWLKFCAQCSLSHTECDCVENLARSSANC